MSESDFAQRRSPGTSPSLASRIHPKRKVPAFDPHGFICATDLGHFRRDYVKEVLEDEIGELTALDQEVVDSLQQHEILSENIGKDLIAN